MKQENKEAKLDFIRVVEKYNLYSDFIVYNKNSRSVFFENLRRAYRNCFLIDAKAHFAGGNLKGRIRIYTMQMTTTGAGNHQREYSKQKI